VDARDIAAASRGAAGGKMPFDERTTRSTLMMFAMPPGCDAPGSRVDSNERGDDARRNESAGLQPACSQAPANTMPRTAPPAAQRHLKDA